MIAPLFLSADELRELTGYAIKARQIAQLRTMGIAFRVNGCGRPVVTRSAVEGGKEQPGIQLVEWKPTLLQFEHRAA
ncbi:MAG: DUF4224 domain-containing protein [Gallionellaceae bacterium]|jgi:hypothetical protein